MIFETHNIYTRKIKEPLSCTIENMLPNDQHQRLDRAFDLVLVLIGIITAASLQYASALEDLAFTTFSLRFLFIPLIPLFLFWLWNQITNNPNTQTFIRIFAWFFGIFTLFTDLVFFIVLSFIRQLGESVIPAIVTFFILYIVAYILDDRVNRAYGYNRRELLPMAAGAYSMAISITIISVFLAYLP